MKNWISVKDKLPEKPLKECGAVCVWVYAVCGSATIQTSASYTFEGDFIFGGAIFGKEPQNKYVTHWQYYPEPPKT